MNDIAKNQNTVAVLNPAQLLEVAVEKGHDVDQLGKLMDLQDRWERKEAEKAFNIAKTRVQSELPDITRNKKVEYGNTKYSYTTLSHLRACVQPVLEKHGFSYSWDINPDATQVVNGEVVPVIQVTCTLKHELGHSESNTIPAYPDETGSKNSVQARGSTITYLQRYTFIGVLGITSADTDDDGRGAGDGNQVFFLQRHNKALRDNLESIVAIKSAIANGDLSSAAECWYELTDEEKQALWIAPTKGGIFTTEERKVMHSQEFREAHYGSITGEEDVL